MPENRSQLLEVREVTVDFATAAGTVHAVDEISFELAAGDTVGLVGESGSGKSATALSIMGLIPSPGRVGGEVRFDGQDLLRIGEARLRALRGREMAMIFQDPATALNPVLSILRQVSEVFRTHLGLSRPEARARSVELLHAVGIPDAGTRGRYPHQYSGGMRQRVMIAMAIACHPRLLIADEPTTALDVTVADQILQLLGALVREHRTALLLITHDLAVIAGMTARVMVMYAGRIVETAPTVELFADPRHPYTAGLLQTVPRLDRPRLHRLRTVPGQPPPPFIRAPGCAFAPRCPAATKHCRLHVPPLQQVRAAHHSACWHWERVNLTTGADR